MGIPYENALQIIAEKISAKTTIFNIPIQNAVKHICAQDVYATSMMPEKPIALKDGYGVSYIDSMGNYMIDPTKSPELSTGDIIPQGILAVVPFEDNDPGNFKIKIGENIKEAGEDIVQGELLLAKGEYIYAYNITSLVSQGIKTIDVFERPKISILSVGDNIRSIDEELGDGDVYNTNALSLAARILELGAHIHVTQAIGSDKEIIYKTLENISKNCDFIITTGAMSHKDPMHSLLKSKNFATLFHKVNIAPAGPSALSHFHETPILHLPGLPLSALLGFELLGVPLLRQIKNEKAYKRTSIHVKNETSFTCKEFCTSAIPGYFNGLTFKSAQSFGAGMLNVLTHCNGYVLTQDKDSIKSEEIVEFFPF